MFVANYFIAALMAVRLAGHILFSKAKTHSELAKKLRSKRRYRQGELAYDRKRRALIQGLLAAYLTFRVASDNVSALSVRSGGQRLHLVRYSHAAFPRYEQELINVKIEIAKVLSQLNGGAKPASADFLYILDLIDKVKALDVGVVHTRVRNGHKSCQNSELGAATQELRLALGLVRKLIRLGSRQRPTQRQRQRLLDALQRGKVECNQRFLSIPTLVSIFDSIDDLPFTTRRVVGSLKRLQKASRFARIERKFEAAEYELDAIRRDLLGGDNPDEDAAQGVPPRSPKPVNNGSKESLKPEVNTEEPPNQLAEMTLACEVICVG